MSKAVESLRQKQHKALNLRALQRLDAQTRSIAFVGAHCVLYELVSGNWVRTDAGCLP
jgi:hypothetical protein